MTPGAVVRFDWTAGGDLSGSTGTYIRSKADNNENAEVVGVVESNDNGEIKIVTGGYINIANDGIGSMFTYPTNPETGLTVGASGGNDIWFLSAVTAGHLQNLEPTGAGQVVKPVLQKVAHPDYNYQVMNYIGYSVAGDVLAENLSYVPVGSYQIVPDFVANTLRAESGYVDATVEHELKLSDYEDFFNLWKDKMTSTLSTEGPEGGVFFYEFVVNQIETPADITSIQTSIENGYSVTLYPSVVCPIVQGDQKIGDVVKLETTTDGNVKITASRSFGEALPSIAPFQFAIGFETGAEGAGVEDDCSQGFSTNEVIQKPSLTFFDTFPTPVITVSSSSSPYNDPTINGVSVPVTQKVILKVKETGAITAPQKLFIDNLKATGLTAAGKFSIPNYTDVESTLTSYGNRITTLEGG